MVNNEAIQLAIADLESQECPNYTATAKKYNISRVTLARRHQGIQQSRDKINSIHHKLLTTAQEEVIIKHINSLTDRAIPPTPKILSNIVQEVVKQDIGEHWVPRFCKRYQDQIKSRYLRAIDQQRTIADNSPHFQHFFNTVRALLYYLFISTNFSS
jgi:hypothetical protein